MDIPERLVRGNIHMQRAPNADGERRDAERDYIPCAAVVAARPPRDEIVAGTGRVGRYGER